MEYLLALVGVLFGWALWEQNKRRSAEALNENQKTKEQLVELDKDKNLNDAHIQVEEEKRNELKNELESEKNKDVSVEEILKFFNRNKSDNE